MVVSALALTGGRASRSVWCSHIGVHLSTEIKAGHATDDRLRRVPGRRKKSKNRSEECWVLGTWRTPCTCLGMRCARRWASRRGNWARWLRRCRRKRAWSWWDTAASRPRWTSTGGSRRPESRRCAWCWPRSSADTVAGAAPAPCGGCASPAGRHGHDRADGHAGHRTSLGRWSGGQAHQETCGVCPTFYTHGSTVI
jgi:hypothetical protein